LTITKTQSLCGSTSTTQTVIGSATPLTSSSLLSTEHSTSITIISRLTHNPTTPIKHNTSISSSLIYATTATSNAPVMPWMESQSPSAVSSINATGTQSPLAFNGAASHEVSQVGKFAFWVGFIALAFLH
jgi:hypothetical protein